MDNTTQKLVNDALTSVVQSSISTKNEGLNILQQQVDFLRASLTQTQEELKQAKEELEESEENVEYYKALLSKPMVEIAQKNGNFKKTYEQQQQIMADWMVSQKAFKELAIEFGFEQGLSTEEVIQKGKDKKLDVLDSKHEESHNTNANTSSIIRPYVDTLKTKFKSERNK